MCLGFRRFWVMKSLFYSEDAFNDWLCIFFIEKLLSLTGSVCFVEFQLPLWLCMMMGPCALLLHVHDVLLCVDLVFKKQ
jgi:hypothetical protein